MKTIYVDTSVFGGKFDNEFAYWTEIFFDKVFEKELTLIFSDVAEDELIDSPQEVKDFVSAIPGKHLQRTELTKRSFWL